MTFRRLLATTRDHAIDIALAAVLIAAVASEADRALGERHAHDS